MRELDVVLVAYLENVYPEAGPGPRDAFARLLECPDPDIMSYLTGREAAPDQALADVIDTVRTSYRPRGA
jgi:antitoxin CptB